jgi:dGTPase
MKKFATIAKNDKRLFFELEKNVEDCFCEDRMRIIASNSFKRLEAKTQVFPSYHGDHYRKRLTHSIEVAEIAKKIASKLDVDKDLAEVVALAHDIGHPPFGHVGEDVLDEIMRSFDGDYKHNTFSFKIVTSIENISNKFSGMNLTHSSLDGILKHNGPLKKPCKYIVDYNNNLPDGLKFDFTKHASIEAQVAAIADDIAYLNHDIEDGLRSDILMIEDVKKLPLWCDVLKKIDQNYSFLEIGVMAKDAKSIIINLMIDDVVAETKRNIKDLNILTSLDVTNCGKQIVDFSEKIGFYAAEIKKFLYANLYHSKKVNKARAIAKTAISRIFQEIRKNPCTMSPLWLKGFEETDVEIEKNQIICDYIAGMTDTFAKTLANKIKRKSVI